ncbi:MAG: hypothetical protein ACT4OX_13410 [Actinomycetota bacterium]
MPRHSAFAVLAAVLLVSGCRVDAHVRVAMDEDGSGVVDARVTLDAEAVARVQGNGRTLETAIVVDDLAAAGWEVVPWARADDGSATLRITREFVGEAQLAQLVSELVGPTEIVRDVTIIRERGLLRSRDELSLAADLRTISAGVQADPELSVSLQAAGLDVAALDTLLSAELREAFRLRVTVEVPGGKVDTLELVPGEERTLAAARSEFDSGRLALMIISGNLVFLAILLYLSASISARRGRERARSRRTEPERTPLM